jgi:hypothetical protein
VAQNQTARHIISDLPKDVLKRIFVVVATRSYGARLSLPLVCKAFHSAVLECPEMWDTFEVMTGNDGALTSKSQVKYVAARAASMPLHVGLMIASSRTGSWRSDSLPTRSDAELDEGTQGTRSLQILGLDMVGTILSLMPRVEDFILDVQDDPLDLELARAVLALFEDHSAGRLKRLTLLGNYQMDRIVRLTTLSNGAPSHLQPSLVSLRHLAVAYCPAFTLPGPLDTIETLEISVISIETTAISYPLEQLLLGFPNLQSLEIRTAIIDTSAPEVPTLLGISPNQGEPPTVSLTRLRRLVLESLPLTSSLLSNLSAPNLQVLTLQQLTLGLDPREVRYETSLAGHLNPDHESDGQPPYSTLQPLPFGTFLARHSKCKKLYDLTLGLMPDMVVRMCLDFVRIVGGTSEGSGDENRGLKSLSLLGFEWQDWESLFVLPPSPTASPKLVPPEVLLNGVAPVLVPLPCIRHISAFLDHASTWTSKGTVAVNYEAKYDREGWMEGLMRFAERRMNVEAVVRMFKESKMELEDWMKSPRGGRDSLQGVGCGIHEDPLRTVMSIELDAGYKDSYAFVHGAWKAIERTEVAMRVDEPVETGVMG